MYKTSIVALFVCLFSLPAWAENSVTCPDLSSAVRVATCPSEEELQFTFTGYCSDNARIYNWNEEQVCTDYGLYRKLKNVVLWEASGGEFQAYLSCDISQDKIRVAKPTEIAVTRQGKMTRVQCGYGSGITFVYRTRSECKVAPGAGGCGADPAACRAICN